MVFLPLSQVVPLAPIACFVPWKSPYFTLPEIWIGSKQKALTAVREADHGMFLTDSLKKPTGRSGSSHPEVAGWEEETSEQLWWAVEERVTSGKHIATSEHSLDPLSWRGSGWPETSSATELWWLFLWK